MAKSFFMKQIAAGKAALSKPAKRKAVAGRVVLKAKKGVYLSGYKLMGTMADGTRVIQPKGSPSFSVEKLRKAVRSEGLAESR